MQSILSLLSALIPASAIGIGFYFGGLIVKKIGQFITGSIVQTPIKTTPNKKEISLEMRQNYLAFYLSSRQSIDELKRKSDKAASRSYGTLEQNFYKHRLEETRKNIKSIKSLQQPLAPDRANAPNADQSESPQGANQTPPPARQVK